MYSILYVPDLAKSKLDKLHSLKFMNVCKQKASIPGKVVCNLLFKRVMNCKMITQLLALATKTIYRLDYFQHCTFIHFWIYLQIQ